MTLLLLAVAAVFAQPRVLLNEQDLDRIRQWADEKPWAAQARAEVLASASSFPANYVQKYGLKDMELPPDGGQWSLWYVCPVHGVSLRYTAPITHTCTVDNRNWTGWPYDQVIFERRHYDLAYAARDNALAFRLTGDQRFGEKAAEILVRYADQYLKYPLKDRDNKVSRSGARIGAQTLDEAIWLIPVAWAYDLLSGSDVLSASQRDHIEKNLLRAAVETIQRNDTGISNWQSWHNAGIGAVAFALQDARLINEVIDGRSGFRFQMKNSVLGEGFWYEGAWGYHYYALDAHVQLAEMAARNGIDLWSEPSLRNMFLTPARLLFADGSLPAFNDSRAVSLYGYARLYDIAYARYGDSLLAAVASRQTRGRNSLFWGAEEVPREDLGGLTPAVFPESGYAVLRAPSNDHTVMMKFGPHGGGHGHYDKLGLISFALGGILGVDPGTQSYAAPTHATWDKATAAHNTLVVDEKSQREATGQLLWHDFNESYSAASADAGPAYANARLRRTLFVTREYTLDLFQAEATDNQPHQFDWIYHNNGTVRTPLSLTPYSRFPRDQGYQHLTGSRAATTSEPWKVEFDGSRAPGGPYGSMFRSNENVQGSFEYSSLQAASGRASGRISYQFSGAGYLLAGTPVIAAAPHEAPVALSVMIHGDGSGHSLALRVNDAADERFVIAVGPVNWTGWKEVMVRDFAKGQHYLGNNDGIVDTPIRTVSFELTRTAQGPRDGAIFVDDIRLHSADTGDLLVADFEQPFQSLRVWMLGAVETAVVTGQGLGPDLLKPVPFVMARRRGPAAEFVTILEPYSELPGISRFDRDASGALRIEGTDYHDTLVFTERGVSYLRRKTPVEASEKRR